MPHNIPGTKALPSAQKGFRVGFKAVMRPASERIGALLIRVAGSDGLIEPRQERALTRAAGEIIQSVFVGSDGRSAFADDGVSPLSPYASLINRYVTEVTIKVVRAQRKWLRSHVPDDVFNWLARARRPQNVSELVSTAARMLPTFIPNALAQYDPLHLWVDPNGYRLSDRIWRAGGDTRQRIDAILAEGIRNGEGALQLSRKLEQFLLPGRAQLRTQKPYGTDASYRGMVLGRTEITRAHGEATLISARLNPYVTGLDWALSASHPRMDICDSLATIGMGGGRLKEPYDLYGAPGYPPHPQCVLPGQMVTTINGDESVENIQSGDLVLTHTGQYCPVKSAWCNPYDGIIYQIETDNGLIEITPEHPVMTLRGWVNAQDLQATDYVLNAGVDVSVNGLIGVMENSPSQSGESDIPPGIFFGSMPVRTIALNSYSMIDQSEVEPETFNPELGSEFESIVGQGAPHDLFNTGFPFVFMETLHGAESAGGSITGLNLESLTTVEAGNEPRIFVSQVAHSQVDKTGVIDLFDGRNLGRDFRPPRWVCISELPLGSFFRAFPLGLAASPIIFNPLDVYSLARGSERDIAVSEQLYQHSELSAKHPVNFRCAEQFSDIESSEDYLDGDSELGFNTVNMLDDAIGACTSFVGITVAELPTDRTNIPRGGFHDNLLSLSPGIEVGAGSGKPVVERAITPLQALLNYTPIRSISTREYAGLVYNMHVENDNSYTVNGIAVHNCLCSLLSVVTSTPAQVTDELRGFMEAGEDAPLTPAADGSLLWLLLGAGLYEWWRRNESIVEVAA